MRMARVPMPFKPASARIGDEGVARLNFLNFEQPA